MYVGRGRHKSKFYRAWLDESWMTLVATHPRTAHGHGIPWQLTVTAVMPNWRRRDLDNVLKPLVDLLADYFGLEDNRLLRIEATKAVTTGESYIEGTVTIDG